MDLVVCILPSMADPSPATVAVMKRCCRCGKDLTGHKRYKDHFGYWCRSCHNADVIAMQRLRTDQRGTRTGWTIALIILGVVVVVLLYLWLR